VCQWSGGDRTWTHLGVNVIHGAEIVDGNVHGVDNSFDKSGTESVFGCCVKGDVLGPVAKGVLDVGVARFRQQQAGVVL
jgi:hypothetical protein